MIELRFEPSPFENSHCAVTSQDVSRAPVPSPGELWKEDSGFYLVQGPWLEPGVDSAGGILPEVDKEETLRNGN